MKVLVSMTTVFLPQNLEDLKNTIGDYLTKSPEDIVECLIILDKTPNTPKIRAYVDKNVGDSGYFKTITPEEQYEIFIKNILDQYEPPVLKELFDTIIPTKSVQRRNFAPFYAIINNFDCIVSIDDDNYPINDDWLYNLINNQKVYDSIKLTDFNNTFDVLDKSICNPMKKNKIVGKGYLSNYNKFNRILSFKNKDNQTDEIVAFQGYSLGEPDRSALSRYLYPKTELKEDDLDISKNLYFCHSLIPFNTQNTVFFKKCFPIMFLFPMRTNENHRYFSVDRIDDNLMSYVLEIIAYYFGDFVGVGKPYTFQKRNYHSFNQDLEFEWNGKEVMEVFMDYLNRLELEGNTYLEVYYNLSNQLMKMTVMGSNVFEYRIFSYARGMHIWSKFMISLFKKREMNLLKELN